MRRGELATHGPLELWVDGALIVERIKYPWWRIFKRFFGPHYKIDQDVELWLRKMTERFTIISVWFGSDEPMELPHISGVMAHETLSACLHYVRINRYVVGLVTNKREYVTSDGVFLWDRNLFVLPHQNKKIWKDGKQSWVKKFKE